MKRFASPTLFLVLGVVIGYWLGFTDAWRGGNTLGARAAMIKYKVSPAGGLSEGRQKNAEALKAHIDTKSGVNQLPP